MHVSRRVYTPPWSLNRRMKLSTRSSSSLPNFMVEMLILRPRELQNQLLVRVISSQLLSSLTLNWLPRRAFYSRKLGSTDICGCQNSGCNLIRLVFRSLPYCGSSHVGGMEHRDDIANHGLSRIPLDEVDHKTCSCTCGSRRGSRHNSSSHLRFNLF